MVDDDNIDNNNTNNNNDRAHVLVVDLGKQHISFCGFCSLGRTNVKQVRVGEDEDWGNCWKNTTGRTFFCR